MSTISVPLTPELEQFIKETTNKTGLTKADVVRQALRHYAEAQAVERVLLAAAEPSLDGELLDLMQQLS
jgi:predicted DNA-binding protein